MKHAKLAVAILGLGLVSSASAQVKPEDEIRYRQSVMNVMGRAFGPMINMAQDKIPYDKNVVAKNTPIVEMMAGLPWNSFGPGTDKGAPTKASPKIWTEQAKFKEAMDKAGQAIQKLSSTVKGGGDEKAVKAAVGDVGKACKGCHDDYREKEFRN
jgi:cytochrome c556